MNPFTSLERRFQQMCNVHLCSHCSFLPGPCAKPGERAAGSGTAAMLGATGRVSPPCRCLCTALPLASRAQAAGLCLFRDLNRNKRGWERGGGPYTSCPAPSTWPEPSRCRVSSSDASASSSLPSGSEGRFRPRCLDTARAYWML